MTRRSAALIATQRLERDEAAARLVRSHRHEQRIEAEAQALEAHEREMMARFEATGGLPLGFGIRSTAQ